MKVDWLAAGEPIPDAPPVTMATLPCTWPIATSYLGATPPMVPDRFVDQVDVVDVFPINA